MLISNVYFFDGSFGLPAMPVTILMSGSVVPKVTTKHMVQSGPLEEAIKMKSPKLGYGWGTHMVHLCHSWVDLVLHTKNVYPDCYLG